MDGDPVPFGDGIYGGGISIHYFTNDDLNGESLDDYIELQNFEDKQTDGDLTIYKNGSKYLVLTHSDDEYLLIKDDNLEEAKTIALSADFSVDNSSDESSDNETVTNSSTESQSTGDLEQVDVGGVLKISAPK